MALGSLVKTLQNIMRNDAGINGDAQRIEQMTWLFFLKIYDAKEEEWEFHDDSYESIIPDRLRWHSWAPDAKDGSALTGDELLDFVNNDLFKTLAGLELDQNAPLRQVVVQAAFTDANNYMKDGILLRQVVNAIDESVDFTEYKERHAFGEIYEIILKDLQSAGNAGEFYTPRAVAGRIRRRFRMWHWRVPHERPEAAGEAGEHTFRPGALFEVDLRHREEAAAVPALHHQHAASRY